MEDNVLIRFESRNAKRVMDDLKGMARLAYSASAAVRGLNRNLTMSKFNNTGAVQTVQAITSVNTAMANQQKQTKKTTKEFNRYHKEQGNLRGQNEGVARSVSSARNAILLYAFATAAVTRQLKTLIDTHLQWEASLFRTEALLKTTSNASGKTADDLRRMAEELGVATLGSSQEILDASNTLLTFKSISDDVFDRALKSSTDLAALGFGSVKSAAIQLGKALEDPQLGLTSLRRVGVSFSEEQQEMIKQLDKQGDRYAAQTVLLSALEAQTKGTAKAAAVGLAGALDSLGESADRLQRQLGKDGLGGLVQGVVSVFTAINNALTSLDQSLPVVSALVSSLGVLLGVAFAGLAVFISTKLIGAIGAFLIKVKYMEVTWNLVMVKMGLSSAALLGWISLITLGIATAITMWKRHAREAEEQRKELQGIKDNIVDLKDSLREYAKEADKAASALGRFAQAQTKFNEITEKLISSETSLDEYRRKIDEIQARMKEIDDLHKKAGGEYDPAFNIPQGIPPELIAEYKELEKEFDRILNLAVEQRKYIEELNSGMRSLDDTIKDLGKSAKFEGIVADLRVDKEAGTLETIRMLERFRDLLQSINDEAGRGKAEAIKALEDMGIKRSTIEAMSQVNLEIGKIDKELSKMYKNIGYTTFAMQELVEASKEFGIDLPESFTADFAEKDLKNLNLMSQRQREINDRVELLGRLRENNLVTQHEAIILQAELNEEMLKTQESLKVSDEFARGFHLYVSRALQDTMSLAEFVASSMEDIFGVMGDAFEQVLRNGRIEWKALIQEFAIDMAKLSLKQLLLNSLANSKLGNLFGGGDNDGLKAAQTMEMKILAGAQQGSELFKQKIVEGAQQAQLAMGRSGEIGMVTGNSVPQPGAGATAADGQAQAIQDASAKSAAVMNTAMVSAGLTAAVGITAAMTQGGNKTATILITTAAVVGQIIAAKMIAASAASNAAEAAAGVALAGGGTYQAGVPRLVGERGPEIEVPSTSGRIMNNTQARERGLLGDGGRAERGTTIVNVLDPSLVGEYLNTPEGEKLMLNVISRNSGTVRRMVAG